MLNFYKICCLLFLLTACTKVKNNYQSIVNYNPKYIQKIPKHKKKIALLIGQPYYFPHCQNIVIYFNNARGRMSINYFNASSFHFHLSLQQSYYFDVLDMCLTCDKKAIPITRPKQICEQYDAPYWELVKIGHAENRIDTLFLEKKKNKSLVTKQK